MQSSTEEKILVSCDDLDVIKSQTHKSVFEPRFVWLVPDEGLAPADVGRLPLTLESNLMSFSYDGDGDSVALYENYVVNSVKSRVVRKNPFGSWRRGVAGGGGGLTVERPLAWERRADLGGAVLTSTVQPWDAINNIVSDDLKLTGFMPELLGNLKSSLNFR